jgi:hypothetical protein
MIGVTVLASFYWLWCQQRKLHLDEMIACGIRDFKRELAQLFRCKKSRFFSRFSLNLDIVDDLDTMVAQKATQHREFVLI